MRTASSTVLLPDIPKFNEEATPAEVKEWLRTIDSQATIAHWNNEQKLETARRLLTNAGREWYLLNADEISTWQNFQKIQTRIQRDKETPREYILAKLLLAKDVGASVSESKAAVCSGLHSADLAKYL